MEVKPFIKYSYALGNTLSFGAIPQEELVKELSSGRLCGVLIEADIGARFENMTKEGCGQGAGEDLRGTVNGIPNQTIQCKTVRINSKTKDTATVGWTTKSGLWDTARGRKKPEEDWDSEHNEYASKYDWFMYINIDSFPLIEFVMIPTSKLTDYKQDIDEQMRVYHFGKTSRKKVYGTAPTDWKYPISITRRMYDSFITEEVIFNG